MVYYSVNSDIVAASSANITSTTERIRHEVDVMMADLLALQDSWKGSASVSFADCIAQWKSVQIHVETSLDSIASHLASASHTYADAESHNAALFSS